MVDKHRLPKLTDVNHDPLARGIGRINFEIQRIQSNATKWKDEKQHRWSSSNFVRYEKRLNSKTNQTKYGQRKRSESLVRPEEVSSRQGQDRRSGNAFLKRYNSEPFLHQAYDEFSVRATSLKLNNRKDESKNPVSYEGFLPTVILDPKLSVNNPKQAKLDSLKNIKMIRDFDKSRKTLDKNYPPSEEKRNETLPNGCKTLRKPELKKVTNAEESVDKDNPKSVKRKGLLPKRRLSEQVGSYEVNRAGNDKTFPRRITIRTSKSCPTIVIHECGESDDASREFWENAKDTKNVEKEGEFGRVGENDLSVLRSRTTSLVACWKPNQSFVNEK